jgi:hypothetical protein
MLQICKNCSIPIELIAGTYYLVTAKGLVFHIPVKRRKCDCNQSFHPMTQHSSDYIQNVLSTMDSYEVKIYGTL